MKPDGSPREPHAVLRSMAARLEAAERKLQALSDSYPVGVYHCDANGSRTYTNQRWQEIFGLGAEQSLGDAWLRALHPLDAAAVTAAWRETVSSGREFDMEFGIIRPNGERRIVRSRARPVLPGSPQDGFVGALEDVTLQRQSEERLRASEAFLSQTGRVAGVGGWEVDLATGTVSWSEQTRAIHEVDEDFHPSLADGIAFYAPEARPVIESAIRQALSSGTPWDLELPFVTAKGRHLWVRAFGQAQVEAGVPVRLVGAFQDITEHRARVAALEHERALRLHTERHASELDRLLKERGEMLDVMAHEVRQPLNNASAALQSAAAALLALGQSRASHQIARAQGVMNQVLASIDNTLAVASLLARPGPIQQADADIDTLLAVVIADIAQTQRPRIHIDRLTQMRTAAMDMSLMRLALRNLLGNALKYADAGSRVTVRLTDSDDPLALVIDVASVGGVIPADLLPKLFTRGARGAHANAAAGHGLGLYIVRRVMELHSGRVEVVGNEKSGVVFRLWLNFPED